MAVTNVPSDEFAPSLPTRGGTAVHGVNDAAQTVGALGERHATILGLPLWPLGGGDLAMARRRSATAAARPAQRTEPLNP